MPKVLVDARNYSGNYAKLNGPHELRISRRDIVHSFLTLGFQNFGDLRSAPAREWLRRLGKGFTTSLSLDFDGENLDLHDTFDAMDGSEKGSESYALGMALSKIVASRVLGVHWLAHVDDMKKQGQLQTSSFSKERGDMAGRCANGLWHVFEAKGRSGPISEELIRTAKRQAARISTIDGVPPATTSACVVSLGTSPISAVLDDPPPEDGIHWDFNETQFWAHYYGSLSAYVKENEGPVRSEKTERILSSPVEGSAAAMGKSSITEWTDKDFAFAPLKSLWKSIPTTLAENLSPLPTYVGLPRYIVENPGSRWFEKEIQEPKSFPINPDGVVLIGPFE